MNETEIKVEVQNLGRSLLSGTVFSYMQVNNI